MNALKTLAFLLSSFLATATFSQPYRSVATVETINGTSRLVQDGKPFIMLGGEMHNSSSSTSLAAESSYRTAKQMGMNSVITVVSWEQLEPEEGRFDFSEIDHIIALANQYGLRTAVAWFGSWKNGESSYAPLWVKSDIRRFFRVRNSAGENTTTLSPLCKETLEADAKAFKTLMSYIGTHDTNHMICLIQVENEVGAFVDIDHSEEAVKAFGTKVPDSLMKYLSSHKGALSPMIEKNWKEHGNRNSGCWSQVFGDTDAAKQIFMAWHFASYVNEVAKAGREGFDLPMYANVWLADDDARFGSYPNGGPRPCVLDVYKAAAPDLDWLSPDVYLNDCARYFGLYKRADNPLFIPEVSREAGPAYLALGEYDAMCYAPFGYEECYNDRYMLGEYEVLNELLPVISEHQGDGSMHGFMRMKEVNQPDDSTSFSFGHYNFHVHYVKGERAAHGLAVQTGPDEFLVAGVGAYITFSSDNPNLVCKIAFAEEVQYEKDGSCNTIFVLNGDETAHNNMLYLRGRMPNEDFDDGVFNVNGPLYRPSYQRMHWSVWQDRFKISGIYRIRLYTYPLK